MRGGGGWEQNSAVKKNMDPIFDVIVFKRGSKLSLYDLMLGPLLSFSLDCDADYPGTD